MYNDFINRLTSTSPETTDQNDGAESGILKKASMSQGDDGVTCHQRHMKSCWEVLQASFSN